jgi:hypothetical protein
MIHEKWWFVVRVFAAEKEIMGPLRFEQTKSKGALSLKRYFPDHSLIPTREHRIADLSDLPHQYSDSVIKEEYGIEVILPYSPSSNFTMTMVN